VLRNVVKAFDDGITKPFIGRMYDWNMQNSDIEDIKGDFEIDARGSSALLVKETQTQALLNLMSVSLQPIYTDLTKHPELYRKAIQAQHLNPDDIVKTNDELEAEKNKPDPMQQAMMEQQAVMMQLQVQELQGKIDKLTAETADINVKTQFSAMQTAGQIVQMPQIVPVGDELMKSAGYKDANGTPSTQVPQGMEQQAPDMQQDQMIQQNTSPGSPALPNDGMPQDPNQPQQIDPQSAAQGMNQGIETQQIEARAEGGPVNAGQPYLVGEQGPEVIVPNGSGTVIPNGQSPNLYEGKYGIETRDLDPSEDQFFKDNPHIGGMAADDNKVIVNPYSALNDQERQAIVMNESARVHMRVGNVPSPTFELTPEQQAAFKSYSPNIRDIKHTIAARVLTNDPSALNVTKEQRDYANQLGKYMSNVAKKR
jgi:hypothetical protein